MELYGKKVILRAIEEEDLELLRMLTNDPACERMIVGWSFPVSKREQMEWFTHVKSSPSLIRYTIATREEGAVGLIGLRDIDWKNGVASGHGVRIAKTETRNRGLATDAWMTLMRFALYELRLNRVNACALDFNKASLRMLEKVGFKIEGIQRQAVYKEGQYHDIIRLGCLRSDYEERLSETHYWEDCKDV